MRWRTCRLCLLISVLLLAPSMPGRADDKKSVAAQTAGKSASAANAEPAEPLFGGVYVSADVFGFIYPAFMKDAYYNNEASVSIDLRHRFFPTAEVGYGHCNTVGQLYGIRYTTAAPYFRLGMDYNMQWKTGLPNYIYCGARVGYSSSTYDVVAPPVADAVSGQPYVLTLTDVPCRSLWAEALVGIRAQVWGNLYMGWNVRYKRPLRSTDSDAGNPWFIPGFGVHGTETVGVNYNLTYYFHPSRKQQK